MLERISYFKLRQDDIQALKQHLELWRQLVFMYYSGSIYSGWNNTYYLDTGLRSGMMIDDDESTFLPSYYNSPEQIYSYLNKYKTRLFPAATATTVLPAKCGIRILPVPLPGVFR